MDRMLLAIFSASTLHTRVSLRILEYNPYRMLKYSLILKCSLTQGLLIEALHGEGFKHVWPCGWVW